MNGSSVAQVNKSHHRGAALLLPGVYTVPRMRTSVIYHPLQLPRLPSVPMLRSRTAAARQGGATLLFPPTRRMRVANMTRGS